ncbi:hypothetical protein [Aestuariivirga sp.]|uniref:hypothetical protein n=1 Tax=Aestuariivirga sp. TaxID=2650926 RepID=UPI003593921C
MTQFIVCPADPSLKRGDRRNFFVVQAASAAAARTRCEALCGDSAGVFDGWTAVALADSSTQDLVVETSHGPVGTSETGNVWPKVTSGGDRLRV